MAQQFAPYDHANAVAKGNQNAMAQMKIQQEPQRQRNAMRESMLQQKLAGLDYIARSAPMVTPETYGTWKQNLESQRLANPGELPDQYDPEVMNRLMGGAKEQLDKYGPMQNIPGMEGYYGQPNLRTGEYANIKQIESREPPEQVDPNAPWANVNDPKERDKAKVRYGASAMKRVDEMTEEAQQAQDVNAKLERFVELNKSNRTGPEYGVPFLSAPIRGVRGGFDPEFQEMASISDYLTPQMRQGMPGAASDRDVAMFRGATVGVEKSPEANENIALGLKAANQNKIDRADFFNDYLTEKGHLRGAEQEWRRYLHENPIFDPQAGEGSYALNENRKTYRQWKATKQTQGPRPGTIEDGYVFMGGDPSDPKSWKRQR